MRYSVLLCISVLLCVVFIDSAQVAAPITAGATGSLIALRGIVVPTIERAQTNQLVEAGSIDTDGFTGLVINVAGQTDSTAGRTGIVGVLLLPEIQPYDQFKTFGILPGSIEVTTRLDEGQHYFLSKQIRFDVGFPRYRVLLYNTSDAITRISLFLYRTRN